MFGWFSGKRGSKGAPPAPANPHSKRTGALRRNDPLPAGADDIWDDGPLPALSASLGNLPESYVKPQSDASEEELIDAATTLEVVRLFVLMSFVHAPEHAQSLLRRCATIALWARRPDPALAQELRAHLAQPQFPKKVLEEASPHLDRIARGKA